MRGTTYICKRVWLGASTCRASCVRRRGSFHRHSFFFLSLVWPLFCMHTHTQHTQHSCGRLWSVLFVFHLYSIQLKNLLFSLHALASKLIMSTPTVPETTTAPVNDKDAATNGVVVVPHRAAIPSRSETPLDDLVVVEEGAAEEDKLFSEMEHTTQEQVEEQPRDVQAAPKLLQQALQAGQVQPSDSEQESDQDEKAKAEAAAKQAHVHPRVCICIYMVVCAWNERCSASVLSL